MLFIGLYSEFRHASCLSLRNVSSYGTTQLTIEFPAIFRFQSVLFSPLNLSKSLGKMLCYRLYMSNTGSPNHVASLWRAQNGTAVPDLHSSYQLFTGGTSVRHVQRIKSAMSMVRGTLIPIVFTQLSGFVTSYKATIFSFCALTDRQTLYFHRTFPLTCFWVLRVPMRFVICRSQLSVSGRYVLTRPGSSRSISEVNLSKLRFVCIASKSFRSMLHLF